MWIFFHTNHDVFSRSSQYDFHSLKLVLECLWLYVCVQSHTMMSCLQKQMSLLCHKFCKKHLIMPFLLPFPITAPLKLTKFWNPSGTSIDLFQLVLWLSMPFCTSLSSIYFFQKHFPWSFYITTHNSIVCVVIWVITIIWWKFHVNSTFSNIFNEKNANASNTYPLWE